MDVGDKQLEGLDLIKETSKKVPVLQERLKITFSRQKSYTNPRRKDVQFTVRDHVFIKVSLMKRVVHFWKRGKLNPRYVEPFEILERVGNVSYHLALPPSFEHVHPIFHISILQKYIPDPWHRNIPYFDALPVHEIVIDKDLSYEEILVVIVD